MQSNFNQYYWSRLDFFWNEINKGVSQISLNELVEQYKTFLITSETDEKQAIRKLKVYIDDNFLDIETNRLLAYTILLMVLTPHISGSHKTLNYYILIHDHFTNYLSGMISVLNRKLSVHPRSRDLQLMLFQNLNNPIAIENWVVSIQKTVDKLQYITDLKQNAYALKMQDKKFVAPAESTIEYCNDLEKKYQTSTEGASNLYFELPNTNSLENEELISNLFDKLKRRPSAMKDEASIEKGFLHSSVLKPQFRKIFYRKKNPDFNLLRWEGTKEELNLFIIQLEKYAFRNIEDGKFKNKWIIAVALFEIPTVTDLTNNKLGAATNYDKIKSNNRQALESLFN